MKRNDSDIGFILTIFIFFLARSAFHWPFTLFWGLPKIAHIQCSSSFTVIKSDGGKSHSVRSSFLFFCFGFWILNDIYTYIIHLLTVVTLKPIHNFHFGRLLPFWDERNLSKWNIRKPWIAQRNGLYASVRSFDKRISEVSQLTINK